MTVTTLDEGVDGTNVTFEDRHCSACAQVPDATYGV